MQLFHVIIESGNYHYTLSQIHLYWIIVIVSLLRLFSNPKHRTEEFKSIVAMPSLLNSNQCHFFFFLHPRISAVRCKSQTFHFPQSTAPVNLRTNLSVRRRVRCMANPRRVKMVAKQIMRELSDMLLTDTVLQHAVLPEAALGADRYLSSLTTISDVEVSNDLQVVKVYVSVFGDDRGKDVAIAGLKSKAKYVRSELGKRMKLRLTPEVRFIEDESLERGSRVIAILDKLKAEKGSGDGVNEGRPESTNLDKDDQDWEVDDPEEDIIYVKLWPKEVQT